MGLLADLPGGPQPPLVTARWEITLRVACLAMTALGFGVALRASRIGGAIAFVGGGTTGGLALFAEHPAVAGVMGLALVWPASHLALSGWRRIVPRSVVLAVMSAGVAGAVVASWSGYQFLYGGTHPGSKIPGPPSGEIAWVWSGGVTADGAVVTAKLRGAGATATLRLTPTIGAVRPTRDGAIVRFEVSGLRPDTGMRYQVDTGVAGDRSGEGMFRTMPAGAASFTVAFSSCARTGSNGAVFDAIRAERPLMYLNLGDLYYANIEDPDDDRFARAFDRVLTLPAQANLYRATSTAYVWDDHDFGPNDADGTSASAPAAHRVYRRVVPHHALALPGAQAPLARAFTVGRTRFIVTDTRSARSPSDMPDEPGKSMLGAAQRRWLERELLAARDRYPVVVWISPVPWIGTPRAGADGWAGYSTERAALAEFIVRNQIGGIVMVSGDNHSVAIDDGTNSGYAAGGAGGFPIIHAGALDREPQSTGGPYSHGVFPGGGQFGTLRVADDGGPEVTVTLRGLNWRRRELTSLSVTMPARPVPK